MMTMTRVHNKFTHFFQIIYYCYVYLLAERVLSHKATILKLLHEFDRYNVFVKTLLGENAITVTVALYCFYV